MLALTTVTLNHVKIPYCKSTAPTPFPLHAAGFGRKGKALLLSTVFTSTPSHLKFELDQVSSRSSVAVNTQRNIPLDAGTSSGRDKQSSRWNPCQVSQTWATSKPQLQSSPHKNPLWSVDRGGFGQHSKKLSIRHSCHCKLTNSCPSVTKCSVTLYK